MKTSKKIILSLFAFAALAISACGGGGDQKSSEQPASSEQPSSSERVSSQPSQSSSEAEPVSSSEAPVEEVVKAYVDGVEVDLTVDEEEGTHKAKYLITLAAGNVLTIKVNDETQTIHHWVEQDVPGETFTATESGQHVIYWDAEGLFWINNPEGEDVDLAKVKVYIGEAEATAAEVAEDASNKAKITVTLAANDVLSVKYDSLSLHFYSWNAEEEKAEDAGTTFTAQKAGEHIVWWNPEGQLWVDEPISLVSYDVNLGTWAAADSAVIAHSWGKSVYDSVVADGKFQMPDTATGFLLAECNAGSTSIIWEGEGANVIKQTGDLPVGKGTLTYSGEGNAFAWSEGVAKLDTKVQVTVTGDLGEGKAIFAAGSWADEWAEWVKLENTNGVWAATLKLAAGDYEFKFIIANEDKSSPDWDTLNAQDRALKAGVDCEIEYKVEEPGQLVKTNFTVTYLADADIYVCSQFGGWDQVAANKMKLKENETNVYEYSFDLEEGKEYKFKFVLVVDGQADWNTLNPGVGASENRKVTGGTDVVYVHDSGDVPPAPQQSVYKVVVGEQEVELELSGTEYVALITAEAEQTLTFTKDGEALTVVGKTGEGNENNNVDADCKVINGGQFKIYLSLGETNQLWADQPLFAGEFKVAIGDSEEYADLEADPANKQYKLEITAEKDQVLKFKNGDQALEVEGEAHDTNNVTAELAVKTGGKFYIYLKYNGEKYTLWAAGYEAPETLYYVVGSFNVESATWVCGDEDFVMSADPKDANHYVFAELELAAGAKLKVWTAPNSWYGNQDADVTVIEAGKYKVDFYVSAENGNHIVLTPVSSEPIQQEEFVIDNLTLNNGTDEISEVEFADSDAQNYTSFELTLKAGDVISAKYGKDDLSFFEGETECGASFFAPRDGKYTFYLTKEYKIYVVEPDHHVIPENYTLKLQVNGGAAFDATKDTDKNEFRVENAPLKATDKLGAALFAGAEQVEGLRPVFSYAALGLVKVNQDYTISVLEDGNYSFYFDYAGENTLVIYVVKNSSGSEEPVEYPEGYYMVGNSILTQEDEEKDWKFESAFLMDTEKADEKNYAEYLELIVAKDAAFKIVYHNPKAEEDTWYATLGAAYDFCAAAEAEPHNLVFSKAGKYNVYLSKDGKIYLEEVVELPEGDYKVAVGTAEAVALELDAVGNQYKVEITAEKDAVLSFTKDGTPIAVVAEAGEGNNVMTGLVVVEGGKFDIYLKYTADGYVLWAGAPKAEEHTYKAVVDEQEFNLEYDAKDNQYVGVVTAAKDKVLGFKVDGETIAVAGESYDGNNVTVALKVVNGGTFVVYLKLGETNYLWAGQPIFDGQFTVKVGSSEEYTALVADPAESQYKLEITAAKDDVLAFKNGEAVLAVTGQAGDGNNVTEGLAVKVGGKFYIYLKKSGDKYILWAATPEVAPQEDPQEDPSEDPVVTGTGYFVRGTAYKGWDDTSLEGTKTTANDNLIELLGVELVAGEFKIANADWSSSYGYYGYQLDGADWTADYGTKTPLGGAASSFEAGSGNNIKCKTAGTYNFYITASHQLYIEAVVE